LCLETRQFIHFALLGSDASNKRKREYAGGPEDGSIQKPPGTAGKGGGLGYNLQAAMGLSGTENEQIYRSLLVSSILLVGGCYVDTSPQQKVRKAAPRGGIDITKTITRNRPIVVAKFIIWVSLPGVICNPTS
jgi:hypothetical protein